MSEIGIEASKKMIGKLADSIVSTLAVASEKVSGMVTKEELLDLLISALKERRGDEG
jgi:hypothetical protein